MIATIYKSEVSGTVKICPSKSYEQRAWAIASLPESEISITNRSKSADVVASRKIAQKLIKFDPNDKIFDCGESALCARMFPPIIALRTDSFILDGHGTLQKRNIRRDLEFFEKNFGWNISSKGFPINISNAHITPGNYTIDGSHTSQIVSGLTLALSTLNDESSITVHDPSSAGYIFLTIGVADEAGAKISASRNEFLMEIKIHEKASYSKKRLAVEGDWSNAAFLIAAGLTNGNIKIKGLNSDSLQPDRSIIEVLYKCHANFEWKNDDLVVHKSDIHGFEFDAHNCPDLIPPLCAIAMHADSECKIYGAKRLIGKESNRLEAIVTELGKLGANITANNCLTIQPCRNISTVTVNSHSDHRIAMMLAILGLSSDGLRIEGCECVEKSYPDFFEALKLLDAKIEINK